MMAFLVVLVLLIVFAIDLDKTKKENKELKIKLQMLSNQYNGEVIISNTLNSNTDEGKKEEVSDNASIKDKNLKTEIRVEKEIKKAKSPEYTKNTLILIAGAILIVLAAIVFLASTWNTIPDIIKTGTLVLLIGVFFGASYLAKNKFDLDLTSKTFYYIAMAYIPIVMFSISVFELFGYYFSISGDGNYIYFSICSIILTILYISEVIRNNKKVLLTFGLLFGGLATIFTILIFTSSFYTILFGLLIYVFAMYLVTKKDNLDKFNLDKLKMNFIIHFILIIVVTLVSTCIQWVMASCGIIDILNIGIITIILYMIQKNKKNLRFLFDIGVLLLTLTIVNIAGITFSEDIKYFIISLVATIMYFLYYVITKKGSDKLLTYISLSSLVYSIALVFEIYDFTKYIPFISIIIVMLGELVDKKDNMKLYLIILFILAFISLNVEATIMSFICILITTVLFIIYLKNEKLSEIYMLIPIIGIMPTIFIEDTTAISSEIIRIIMSLTAIGISTAISVLKKHKNVYLTTSITFIILNSVVFEFNKYITLILVLAWAILHILTYDKKEWFKLLAYVTVLSLYNEILGDLGIRVYTVIHAIGYLACIYLITRTIVMKHSKSFKIIEYILTSILFIYALNSYIGLVDSMIFIAFLFILVILAYSKKIGPLFLTSLIAIVINVFKLTKVFWQSIPWWVYMLVIGTALITFAMRNEITEKTDKGKFKDVLERFKENIGI